MIIIHHIGAYFLMLQKVFRRFVKWSVLKELIIKDIDALIIGSIGIVAFISFFVGGVVAIQTALNLTNPFLPQYLIGFATRQSVILMAGKVGSFITSSLGTMRVTEQIEALKVMGINTYNYLIFPKIVAMFFYPFVIVVSMFLGIIGGYFASIYGGFCNSADFIQGIQLDFIPFHVGYAFLKTIIFSFILATVPSYHGYFLKGGALEVGKASTTSFVWTSVLIIIANYLTTQLLLT